MRFLFGLLVGAVLTISVATVFNVPTHAMVDRAKQSWDDLLLAVGEALFEFPVPPASVPELAVAEPAAPVATREIDVAEAIDQQDDALADPIAQLPVDAAPPAVEPPPATVVDPDLPAQTVWTPFRSQMSAEGFAGRLSSKLDHPFRVNREGPGRYQVMFSYASELERLELLDQVQSVTVQDPQ